MRDQDGIPGLQLILGVQVPPFQQPDSATLMRKAAIRCSSAAHAKPTAKKYRRGKPPRQSQGTPDRARTRTIGPSISESTTLDKRPIELSREPPGPGKQQHESREQFRTGTDPAWCNENSQRRRRRFTTRLSPTPPSHPGGSRSTRREADLLDEFQP